MKYKKMTIEPKGRCVTLYDKLQVYENGALVMNGKVKNWHLTEVAPYPRVCLFIDNKSKIKAIKNLVYEAFSGDKLTRDYVVVNINGDILDCRYENLKKIPKSEWQIQQNIKTYGRNKVVISDATVSEICEKYAKRDMNSENPVSVRSLAKEYNLSLCMVQRILRGERKGNHL